MKKKLIIGLVIVVFIAAGILMARETEPDSDNYVIGAALPFTGQSASFGERIQPAIEIALEEINTSEKYPFTVSVHFEDTAGEAPSAVSAIRKLIDTQRINVIIGTVKSDALLAVAPIMESERKVLFSPTAGAEEITYAGDYVFRNIESPAVHGKVVSDFFLAEGLDNVALLTAQASNAKGYGNTFRESFLEKGGRLSFDTEYASDQQDFRSDITKMMQEDPSAVFLAVATARDCGIATRQLRELGFTKMIVASVACDAPELFTAAGDSSEGLIIASSAFDPNGSNAKEFNTKYRAATGQDSDGFAANGYDAAMLIAEAINSCGGDTAGCVRDYLYRVKNYPGAGGLTTFDENGDVSKPVQFKVIQNRSFFPLSL